jgi:hypothetical protein
MSDYKPKERKDPYTRVWCVLCHEEIPVGARYHWVKSKSAGVRPFCLECAEKHMKIKKVTP